MTKENEPEDVPGGGNEEDLETILKRPDVKSAIEAAVSEELKDIKAKLNTAYKKYEDTLNLLKDEKAARDALQLELLEKDGKTQEALNLKVKQAEDAAKAAAEKAQRLEQDNIELSRNMRVSQHLSSIPFKNAKAMNIALNDINDSLVRNDKGEWTGKDGTPIEQVVEAYVKSSDNAFLLKPPTNSGTGTGGSDTSTGGAPSGRKLSEMPQEEVFQLAASGNLPKI